MAEGDTNKMMITEDEPTDVVFSFEKDEKKYKITKHFVKLSGFVNDYLASIPAGSDNTLPIVDFPSSSHEILIELLKRIKNADPAAYQKGIKQESVENEVPHDVKEYLKTLTHDQIIDTANYCAFLSMDFAKRYFVWSFASLLKETSSVLDYTNIIGSHPLEKADIEAHQLQDEAIWLTFQDVYKRAYGKEFKKDEESAAAIEEAH